MSFWEIIGTAWRDAILAIRRNLPVFLAVFLALFILTWALDVYKSHHIAVVGPHLHGVPRLTPFQAGFIIVQDIITAIIVAPLMVAVHRFVLIGEFNDTLRNKRRLMFFALYLIFINLMRELPNQIEGVTQPQSASQILLIGITLVSWIIVVRFVLTYPAAALDKPSPLDDSWVRTRGRWWYIVSVMICGFLPIFFRYRNHDFHGRLYV